MNFLTKVAKSFINPDFYNSIQDRSLASMFGYFFSIISILSVAIAFILGVQMAPIFSQESLRGFAGFYPKDLEVRVKSGVISTNVTEPYIIKDEKYGSDDEDPKRANFLVIDTKSDFSMQVFEQYDTKVWIGKNFAVTTKNSGQFEYQDLSKMPDFTLNYEKILHWVDLIASYHFLISIGLFVVLLFGFLLFFTVKLLGLLVISLLIMLFGKIKKISLSYKDSYKIALYAITWPLIIQTIFVVLHVGAPVPFFFSIILLVIVFLNIKKIEKNSLPVS